MISCFVVIVAIRSQRKQERCPDFLLVSFYSSWKMGRKGSWLVGDPENMSYPTGCIQ